MTNTPPANALAQFKLDREWTDEQLGELLGLDRPYVVKLRRGQRKPSLAVALKIQERTQGKVPVEAWRELDDEAAE